MIVEKKKNFEYIDSIALDCKRTKGTQTLKRTHPSESHASRSGPHTHTLTHNHTGSPTHQGVSNAVYSWFEWLWNGLCRNPGSLIHCRPKRAQNYSFFPFDETHTPDTQSIKIHLVHRSVCGMKWIHNALNGNTLREEERETESGTTQHFQFLSEAQQDFLQLSRFKVILMSNIKHFLSKVNTCFHWKLHNYSRITTTDKGQRRCTDGRRLKKKRYITHHILLLLSCILWMGR